MRRSVLGLPKRAIHATFPLHVGALGLQSGGRMLRGTIQLHPTHNGHAVENFEGDAVYAWNAEAKRIDYTFWANDGTYGTAKAYLVDDTIVHVGDRPADSKAPEVRSVWRRIDADTFEVAREKKNGDA